MEIIKPSPKHEITPNQSGNVFFYILLGVILFAALAFTISHGIRGYGTSALSKQQNNMVASELLDFTNKIELAVGRLREKGCSENEISFQRDVNNDGNITDTSTDHFNPTAPSNKSCHIYEKNGASIRYETPIENLNIYVTGHDMITDIGCTGGNNCAELIITTPVNKDLCEAIQRNLRAEINTLPTDTDEPNHDYFDGTFTALKEIGDSDNSLKKQPIACYYETDNGTYHFYRVLIAR